MTPTKNPAKKKQSSHHPNSHNYNHYDFSQSDTLSHMDIHCRMTNSNQSSSSSSSSSNIIHPTHPSTTLSNIPPKLDKNELDKYTPQIKCHHDLFDTMTSEERNLFIEMRSNIPPPIDITMLKKAANQLIDIRLNFIQSSQEIYLTAFLLHAVLQTRYKISLFDEHEIKAQHKWLVGIFNKSKTQKLEEIPIFLQSKITALQTIIIKNREMKQHLTDPFSEINKNHFIKDEIKTLYGKFLHDTYKYSSLIIELHDKLFPQEN